MMIKINRRLVGRMWVSVPGETDLRDIEIVTASPNKGSTASSSQALLYSHYLAAIEALVWA